MLHARNAPDLRRDLFNRLGLIIILSLLAACGPAEPRPVELAPEDMCAFCKMAISEKRFAAEFVTADGEAIKFDDLGCLLNHRRERPIQYEIAAYFVVDFDSREWVRAEDAHYVRSPQFKTPMGAGIAAFKDRSRAEASAAELKGQLLRFAELTGS